MKYLCILFPFPAYIFLKAMPALQFAIAYPKVTLEKLGLSVTNSWPLTVGLAIMWLGLMLIYSRFADWLATRWVKKPPTLNAFRVIQKSKVKLIAGILASWVLGGVLEELIFRGIILRAVESFLSAWLIEPAAAGIAVCTAALGAGIVHFYQGPRAMIIITQLSILFGVLFVVSGYNLWTVMLCHGLYDTIAFVRFASKKSKYSNLNQEQAK